MHAWLALHLQAAHEGGDAVVAGLTVSVDPGAFQLKAHVRNGTSATALVQALAAPGTTLRLGAALGSTVVVELGLVTLALMQNGVIPLIAPFDGPVPLVLVPVHLTGTPSTPRLRFSTPVPQAPASAPPPVAVNATGGSVILALRSPADTGGLPVTSFVVTITALDLTGLNSYLLVRV